MTNPASSAIRVIDSHTGGEPTRIVIEGGPDLGGGSMRERRDVLREKYDWLRTSLCTEPRGSTWMIGAVLEAPVAADAACGIIYFNNVGYLGMCGHGTIGLVATLAHLGRIKPGTHKIETPVGDVFVRLEADGAATFDNVRSYRRQKDVTVEVPGLGRFVGDVAWGGNWFFIVKTDRKLLLADAAELTDITLRIRDALEKNNITGDNGAWIDHVELAGPPSDPAKANIRNFVMCPGGEYDRSPCGTGTSAKLACLAADGKLAPNTGVWRQESIVGSIFEGRYRPADHPDGGIIPTVTGRAWVNGDVRLVIDPADPFKFGIDPEPAKC
jgi:4-hydroxyproline epimerase